MGTYFTPPAVILDGTTAKADDVNDLTTAIGAAWDVAEPAIAGAAAASAAAAISAAAAAADAILTAADVVSTNADVVTTTANAAATAADLVATNQDTIDTAADAIATAADAAATALDKIATNADVVLTNADVVLTHADVVLTAADVVTVAGIYDSFDDRYLGVKAVDPTLDNDGDALVTGAIYFKTGEGWRIYNGATFDPAATNAEAVAAAASAAAALVSENAAAADAAQTAADLVATNQDTIDTAADLVATNQDTIDTAADAVATAADRVQTGLDVTATAASAASAAASAASINEKHDSLNAVMLPTDWEAVNKQGWDHFGFNQQWGGAPWGGRLPDGTDGEVAACQLITDGVGISLGSGAANTYRSQGFVAAESKNHDTLTLKLGKVLNPTGNTEVYIYTDSGGSPGTLITNGTATPVANKTISTSQNTYVISFPAAFSLTKGSAYHIVVKADTINATNYVTLAATSDNNYPFGFLHTGDATPAWTAVPTYAIYFQLISTAATATIRNGKFYPADTTQLGQALALTQSIKDVIQRDKDGKFSFQFKVDAVPTPSKPICQAYYDNDVHITVEADASSHIVIRSNGSTITGTTVIAQGDSIAPYYDGTNLNLAINGIDEGTPIAVSFPDDFDTGTFIVGGAIPTDLTWTKETDMSLLPSADGWTYAGTATEANAFSVSDGKLYQNAAGTGGLTATYVKTPTLNNATGWRIAIKNQVLNAPNTVLNSSAYVRVRDGAKDIWLFFQEYFIEIYDGGGSIDYVQIDMKSSPRETLLYGKGSDFYLFSDGKLVFDGTGLLDAASAVNEVSFGDETAGDADVIWHYVNYIESYEAPTFTTTPLYDFGFWQKDASSLLVDLAASDVKSITGLKENWVGEAERSVEVDGIVANPTTASTSNIQLVDMHFFCLGSMLDIRGKHTTYHTTANATITTSIAVNGEVVDESMHRQWDSAAGQHITDTVASLVHLSYGLQYAEMQWRTSSGTATGNGTFRNMIYRVK